MDFDHNHVRAALDEDRFSGLPLELIIQILSRVDTKLAIQMCLLLFPRWKLIWTLLPSLNFSSIGIESLAKYSKFVTHVLSHRNHQVEVSSVNLCFRVGATQDLVREIANYVISHNVQQLILDISCQNEFLPYLFRCQTVKHLTYRTFFFGPDITPKTPWDFPSLMTLYLQDIWLCIDQRESIDLFSKCVNLQNLTLESVTVNAEVFEIITPRLANLRLKDYRGSNVIKVIAHQLENLTVIYCSVAYMNIPSGLASFCYQGFYPPQWFKECFNSVNKVTVSLSMYSPKRPYKQKDARGVIKMLQELHCARFLMLNLDIVECISSFPELLSTKPLPFSNLIRLNVDTGTRDTCKRKMSTKARNFLLGNSPNATFIMKELPTEAMKNKEIMAKLVVDIKDVMKELKASLEQDNIIVEPLISKKEQVRCLLDRLPKRQRKQMEARYSLQLQQAEALISRPASHRIVLEKIGGAFRKNGSSTSEDVFSFKHPLPSQPSSSSTIIMPA